MMKKNRNDKDKGKRKGSDAKGAKLAKFRHVRRAMAGLVG